MGWGVPSFGSVFFNWLFSPSLKRPANLIGWAVTQLQSEKGDKACWSPILGQEKA